MTREKREDVNKECRECKTCTGQCQEYRKIEKRGRCKSFGQCEGNGQQSGRCGTFRERFERC